MKKQVLKLTNIPEPTFLLVGISSHENDYRLSWAMNNQLNTKFTRIENYAIHDQKNGIRKEFSQYEYNNEELFIKHLLIANQGETGYLIPEFKNIDFFIVLLGEAEEDYLNQFLMKLKSVDIIHMAVSIEAGKLKSKSNLSFNI